MNPSWVPILCYHRVCPEPQFSKVRSICVTPEKFRSQMSLLKTLGYSALSLQNLVAYLRLQKNIPKSVVVTFDDGYQDNLTYAWPILKDLGMTANIFLVTDLIGKANVWDQENVPLLTRDEISQLRDDGVNFGSHTANHMDLSRQDAGLVKNELEKSKELLEKITSRKDIPFCYPYGKMNKETKRWVREAGYLCGVATDSGPLEQASDLFEMRRVQIFPSTSLFGFWKKIQPWYPRWAEIQKKAKRL